MASKGKGHRRGGKPEVSYLERTIRRKHPMPDFVGEMADVTKQMEALKGKIGLTLMEGDPFNIDLGDNLRIEMTAESIRLTENGRDVMTFDDHKNAARFAEIFGMWVMTRFAIKWHDEKCGCGKFPFE